MMKFRVVTICALAVAVVLTATAEERYKVIAHPSVPITSAAPKDLSPLFLKKVTSYEKWGSAQKVVPFDLGGDSATREAFTKSVHGKALTAIKSYWQQQIFSGRGTPPAELPNDGEVIAAVARTAGAIGYVSIDASLPATVKQIRLTQ
jgi:ABC-type phosphate transport system substrate-binding protein